MMWAIPLMTMHVFVDEIVVGFSWMWFPFVLFVVVAGVGMNPSVPAFDVVVSVPIQ